MRMERTTTWKILFLAAALFCAIIGIGCLSKSNDTQTIPQTPISNSSGNLTVAPQTNGTIITMPIPSDGMSQADKMRQVYVDFYGAQTPDNTPGYFERLANLGWTESSFREVINNSLNLEANQILILDSGRTKPVFLNIGVGQAQTPEYAKTWIYRQNGQYGVISELHLEMSPPGQTPVEFWTQDYAYPVNHEMRHVKKFFEAGIFDDNRQSGDLGSNALYSEYLDKTLMENDISSEFNTTGTAEDLDELEVVLETDNPQEISLNLDRLNNFTVDTFKNDVSVGVEKVAPVYLEQIVLARHLSEAYSKPSVQRLNYPIRSSAFERANTLFNTTIRDELYKAYPNDTDAMQKLEAIYEEAAKRAIMENTN